MWRFSPSPNIPVRMPAVPHEPFLQEEGSMGNRKCRSLRRLWSLLLRRGVALVRTVNLGEGYQMARGKLLVGLRPKLHATTISIQAGSHHRCATGSCVGIRNGSL